MDRGSSKRGRGRGAEAVDETEEEEAEAEEEAEVEAEAEEEAAAPSVPPDAPQMFDEILQGAPPRAWRDYFSLAADGAGGAALLPLTEPAFCKALYVSNSAGKKAGAPPRKRFAGAYGRRRGAPDYGAPARSSSFERGAGHVAHKHRG